MIVLIDNYDSFTYNLVQMMSSEGGDLVVHRNDMISAAEVVDLAPDGLVISPGPGTPENAGISVDLIKRFSGKIPILGVCLGHQCIGAAFGGVIANAQRIMHGKVSSVTHDGKGIYEGVPNPLEAGRYHSLVQTRDTVPAELVVDAKSDDDEIMGMRHKEHLTYGVQFHPESVLTPDGRILLKNFLNIVADSKGGNIRPGVR